jgi:hypothetical protein
MPIVKKKDGKFVESYEINSFNVSIDQKSITVILSKYTLNGSGVPTAEDFSYMISDRKDFIPKTEIKEIPTIKRSENGAIIFDSEGNPIVELKPTSVETSEQVTLNALSEIMAGMTSGKNLYTEIKLALYKNFIKYYLNDSKEYTIE